jgi:transposase
VSAIGQGAAWALEDADVDRRLAPGSRLRRLLRATGIKLFFLPPYAPDLNPIDEMFTKLKRLDMPQSKSERL